MAVKRIVPDFAFENPEDVRAFYENVLGLKLVMNQGWIVTFASDLPTTAQISIASEGGSGAPVPDVSIEVDNIDEVYRNAKAGKYEIAYELCNEPWGVRRFFVRDPTGRLLNILQHIG
ncbi:MAG: VOC family protein [Hyphomicrobiales bacterium]